jgi:hypothetical protein
MKDSFFGPLNWENQTLSQCALRESKSQLAPGFSRMEYLGQIPGGCHERAPELAAVDDGQSHQPHGRMVHDFSQKCQILLSRLLAPVDETVPERACQASCARTGPPFGDVAEPSLGNCWYLNCRLATLP